jgi:hypothetical protein
VQEEQTLAQAPKRRRAELVRTGRSLIDSIRQTRPHVMNGKIGVGVVGEVAFTTDRLKTPLSCGFCLLFRPGLLPPTTGSA